MFKVSVENKGFSKVMFYRIFLELQLLVGNKQCTLSNENSYEHYSSFGKYLQVDEPEILAQATGIFDLASLK